MGRATEPGAVPDLAYLEGLGHKVAALFLTHGHEDHIGGLPYLMPLVEGPVYGSRLALALVENRLEQHSIDVRGRLKPVAPRERVQVGPFTIECLRVTHSMPDCLALAIHTPAGVLVHTLPQQFMLTASMDGKNVSYDANSRISQVRIR